MVEETEKELPPEKGAGFLFWGWIVVTVVNLTMIVVALALFAP